MSQWKCVRCGWIFNSHGYPKHCLKCGYGEVYFIKAIN